MQLTEEQFNEIQDLFPKPPGQCSMGSSAGTQRYSVHSETRLPLAQPACVLWALEHGVRADEALGGAWGVGGGVRAFARSGSGRIGHRDSDAGQHLGEGTCGWDG